MKLSYLFTGGEGLDKSNLEFNLQDFWLRLRTYSKSRWKATPGTFFTCTVTTSYILKI